MKRYTLHNPTRGAKYMVHTGQGEWVKFDEVKDILYKLGYGAGEKHIERIVECDCKEKVDAFNSYDGHDTLSWICPAHGYKRI
jgi:hypothetical protein